MWQMFSSVCYLYFGISEFNMQTFYILIYSKSSIFRYSESSPQRDLTSLSWPCTVACQPFCTTFHRPGYSPFTALHMVPPCLKCSSFTSPCLLLQIGYLLHPFHIFIPQLLYSFSRTWSTSGTVVNTLKSNWVELYSLKINTELISLWVNV